MQVSFHEPLFSFEAAAISRAGSQALIQDLGWEVRDRETWALVGPTGSGKTTLAETLLGRHRINKGRLRWPLLERLSQGKPQPIWPSEVLGMVGFREDSRLFSYRELYYQQRFEFAEEAKAPTVAEFLQYDNRCDFESVTKMAGRLGIARVLNQPFLTLSNGETRRSRIARALLQNPLLLILDDPFAGLDSATRTELDRILSRLVEEGARILLLTSPNHVPSWITHILELEPGRVGFQGESGEWQKQNKALDSVPHQIPHPGEEVTGSFKEPVKEPHHEVIGLEKVTVKMGPRTILEDVSWMVRQGDRWALVGPNGSGKTTLLSLLCGDHPQAFCNTVRLFGRQRGTGESIWDIKKKVGLVSPELHIYFSEPMSARDTAATGFFDVLTRRSVDDEQGKIIDQLFDYFGLTAVAGKLFSHLSTGQQRLVFLVRALVKQPPLLLLDEPFQGLDQHSIELARRYLDERLLPDQTLVFVTHVPDEQPDCLKERLVLEKGRIVEMTKLK